MRQRENQPASHPPHQDLDEAGADDDLGERVSPARERAADQVVQRATRGLMRVDSRRRMRLFFRRLFIALIMAGAIAGIYYGVADELLSEYWEQVKAKLLLPIS